MLAGFLHALAVAAEAVPQTLGERAALYRSLLAGKKALIVLDNAASEEQVRPLLPGSRTCAVLITSRAELAGLEEAEPLPLEVMEPDAAVELLGRVAGPGRLAGQSATAEEIVHLCGYLPLAVRIAGAKLRLKRHWRPAMLAERLADERRRLAELTVRDREVRASFDLSYQELDPVTARAFRHLGSLTGPDIAAPVTAALLDSDPAAAEGLLEQLVDAQLLDPAGEGRFRFHDLLRLFAQERLEAEETPADQEAALERAWNWYLNAAEAADALIGGSEAAAAIGWLEAERANVVAAIEQTHAAKRWELTWQMSTVFMQFYLLRGYWVDWQHTHELAVDATRRAGNRLGEATTLGNLGIVYRSQGRWAEAIDHYEQALAIFHDLGNRLGEAQALANLGPVYRSQGRWAEAIDRLEQALAIFHDLGNRLGEATTLGNLGIVYRSQGRWAEAIDRVEQALAIFHDLGDRQNEAVNLMSLGVVYSNQGHWAKAIDRYQKALAVFHDLGDRQNEAQALGNLGNIYQNQGRWAEGDRSATNKNL